MIAAPNDVRHVFAFGAVRLTRYAITQPLLVAAVIALLVSLVMGWRKRRA
jgi:uncharacterized membrane protein YtjA (UPF0391 family)